MILRISLLLFFLNAFLASSKLPDGLFTAKEIGLYFAVAIISFFALVILLGKNQHNLQILWIDLLILSYLWILPIIQALVFDTISISDIFVQLAYGFSFFSIRVLCSRNNPLVVISVLREVVVLIVCFQLLIAIAQYQGIMPSYYPMFGVTGMFFNPGPFAIFTAVLLAFLGANALHSLLIREYLRFSFYISLVVSGSSFIILSLSRTAWISLIGGMLVSIVCYCFIRYRRWFLSNRKNLSLISIGLLALLLPAGFWLYSIKSGSADGRVLVWLSTLKLIGDNSLAGVGIGHFASIYIYYQADFLKSSDENLAIFGSLAGDSRYAFNDLLQIFAEVGIVGFILFILICVQAANLAWKIVVNKTIKRENLAVVCGIIGSIATLLIASLTSYPLQMIPIALLFWVFISVITSISGKQRDRPLNKPVLKSLILVLFFIGGSGYSYYGFLRTKAYLNWMQTETGETHHTSLFEMEKSYPILKDHAEFLFSYSKHYIEQGNYNEAVKHLEQVIKYSPAPAFYYLLGNCYEKLGYYDKSKRCYQLIRLAIPNLLKPRYLDAQLYLHQKDTTAFLVKAKEALDFQPKIYNKKVEEMRSGLEQQIKEIGELK